MSLDISQDKRAFLKKQSVEVGSSERPKGQTNPIRHAKNTEKLLDHDPSKPEVRTLYSNLKWSVDKFPDRNLFGTRDKTKGYQWVTYKEFYERAVNFGFGLLDLGLGPKSKIGIYSKNRIEWEIAEHGANSQSMPTIAIYDTFGPEVVEYIINHAELPVVVASADQVPKVLEVASKCPGLKYVVQMEPVTPAMREKVPSTVSLLSIEEVEEKGKKNPSELHIPEPSDLAVIMYTSGTTGPPKGVMHTHSNLMAAIAAILCGSGFKLLSSDIAISYLPLAHIFERVALGAFINAGASVGFYSGDAKDLVADIQELHPTVMCGVPRIFERVYAAVSSQVDTASFLKKKLFHKAYNKKLKNFQNPELLFEQAEKMTSFWNKLVFAKLKGKLGGSIRLIISGAAPLSPQTHSFIKVCFGCPVVQGYGLTETCAGGTLSDIDDPLVGHVGPPIWGTEIKLVDVEDMNYKVTNSPSPEGEIWIRGPTVSQGYYKDEAKTKEDFDAEGWFHTGDVGRWNPNGSFSIIDRKKNIFKLSQGEYIAAEKLELKYATSRFVNQLFVYGDSFTPFLVCIVVPEQKFLEGWAKEHKLLTADMKKEDYERICNLPELKKAILEEFNVIEKNAKLNSFEGIKAVIVSSTEWTPQNELVTPTMKLKRQNLKKFYEDQIVEAYETLGVKNLPYSKKDNKP